MQALTKSSTKLEHFPPKLRKLGQYIISCGQLMTLKEACESTGINYDTVRTLIARYKRKGKDFHSLVNDCVIEKLVNARPDVYRSLQEKAISGSLGHQKLFSEIVGDHKNKVEVDHRITGLFAVFTSHSVPEANKEMDKVLKPNGVQIIDAEEVD